MRIQLNLMIIELRVTAMIAVIMMIIMTMGIRLNLMIIKLRMITMITMIMMIIMTIMKAQMVTIPSPQMEHDSYGEDNRISTVDTPTAMSAALFLSPPKPQLPLVSTKVPQRERPEGVS